MQSGIETEDALSRSDQWSVGRLDPRLVRALTLLGFGVPAAVYLAVLSYYQVNVVLGDQWDDVGLIRASYADFPDWSALWHQHTDNRIFFPNLIVLALAHTVAFNIEVEEFLGALMLFAATALIIWAHWRRSRRTPLLFYVPVAFLMLTIAQWQNMLWGFQLAWYLVLLSLAAAIALLDRVRLTWPIWSAAIVVAIVGSYSSLQGLLIWPVGLFLLYHRRRSWPFWAGWIVATALTTAFYFHNYTVGLNLRLVTLLPYQFLQFFLYALGDMVGVQQTAIGYSNPVVMAFGVFLFVFAVLVLLVWGIRRDSESGAPVALSLVIWGLLFDALVTQGRLFFGFLAATQSRYTTYDVLVLVGIYLAILDHPPLGSRLQRGSRFRPVQFARVGAWTQAHMTRINRCVLSVVLAAAIVQVLCSFHFGLEGARTQHALSEQTAEVTRNIDHEPNSTVVGVLYLFEPANVLRADVRFLRTHHLSLFG